MANVPERRDGSPGASIVAAVGSEAAPDHFTIRAAHTAACVRHTLTRTLCVFVCVCVCVDGGR